MSSIIYWNIWYLWCNEIFRLNAETLVSKPQNSANSWKCTLHIQDVYFIEKDVHCNINNISLNSLHCIPQNITYLNALVMLRTLPASTKMRCINQLTHAIHGLSFSFQPIPGILHLPQLPKHMCWSPRKRSAKQGSSCACLWKLLLPSHMNKCCQKCFFFWQ